VAVTPAVSVIIPTYDCRPLLEGALEALRKQTLPADDREVIVIDDGSTDDTWAFLQETATSWPQLTIIKQPHSGHPSIGRNLGLRRARGRYVFFHDADDWMPPDALRRLVADADRLRSDVVVGRARVIGGRREASLIRTADDADLIKDKVWTTLSAQKLFRRSFLSRLRLEFCEDMIQGEDQVFVAAALLAARRVTTRADEDYYVRRRTRQGGGNLSDQPQSLHNKVLTSTRLTRLVIERAGKAQQTRLLTRVMIKVLAPGLAGPFMRATEAERDEALAELQRTVLPHLAPLHLERAEEDRRLRLLVAAHGTSAELVALNKWLARQQQGEPPDAVRRLIRTYDPGRSDW
jgi:hypothetical protein